MYIHLRSTQTGLVSCTVMPNVPFYYYYYYDYSRILFYQLIFCAHHRGRVPKNVSGKL